MNSSKSRSSLMGIAGAYLLYLAWQLLQSLKGTESKMAPALTVLFAVVFCGAGAALLVYALKIWKKPADDDEKSPPEDKNSLK